MTATDDMALVEEGARFVATIASTRSAYRDCMELANRLHKLSKRLCEWADKEALARQEIGALKVRVEELETAARTRPDYDLRCDECGAPHWLDTSIDLDIWDTIAPNGGVLCLLCIDAKVASAGLKCEAEFYFTGRAVVSKLYTERCGEIQNKDKWIEELTNEVDKWRAHHADVVYRKRQASERISRLVTLGDEMAELLRRWMTPHTAGSVWRIKLCADTDALFSRRTTVGVHR